MDRGCGKSFHRARDYRGYTRRDRPFAIAISNNRGFNPSRLFIAYFILEV